MNIPIDRDLFVHELAMNVTKEHMREKGQYRMRGDFRRAYTPTELSAIAVTAYKEALDYIDTVIVKEWVDTN